MLFPPTSLARVRPFAGLLLLPLLATQSLANVSSWIARAWQTGDGLPNNTVTGVVQTPDGYLWLGTPTGLVRFDGVQFQAFPSTNFVELTNRGILMMTSGWNGGLRLAMDRGAVVILDSGASRALMPARDLPDEGLYLLAEDREGALWISYRTGNLCRVKDGKVTRFSSKDGLPEEESLCVITCDEEGRLWFAKGDHFGIFRNGRFETLRHVMQGPIALAPAQGGGLWLCEGAKLLRFVEKDGFKRMGEFDPIRSGVEPSALLEDRQGNVWIGTAFNGLFLYDGSGFESIPIAHKEVSSLAEDSEGNIWVGTRGGGLNRIRARAVELEGAEQGLPFEALISLCEDNAGTIWGVTQDGLMAKRVAEGWQPFSPAPDWDHEATCVTADPRAGIWIGTESSGLFCWRDGELVDWRDATGVKGTVRTLQFARDGSLWIGEDNPDAVQCLRDGKLFTPEAPPEESLRVIRAMTRDASGTVWAGSSRGLLLRAEGDRLVDVTLRITGSTNSFSSIRCLYSTPDGSVWIGYAGWGIGRIKNGRFAAISTEQGLYDDWISHIVSDGRGWMWFGGDRGLFKVSQRELDAVAEGNAARVRSIHYGKGEGLPSLQATFGGSPGVLRSHDGRLWIPMRTGLAVVYPDKPGENADPPPVLVNRMTVDDRTVAMYSGVVPNPDPRVKDLEGVNGLQEPLRLPPGHRRVHFEYSAMSFTTPENVHFRHRLEGYEDDWVDGGTERGRSFSRLPAGNYQFHVIACNSEGVWNERGAVLSFVVTPFFWQRWWFRGLMLTAFTLGVVAIVRYVSFRRLRLQMLHLEEQAALYRERDRIARDIHDDLGGDLTQIGLLSEFALQDRAKPDQADRHIEKISATARHLIKSMDEIVWAVNPHNDTLAHLIDYAGQFAVDYLSMAEVRCRLDFPDQTPDIEVSTEVRHNLFLIVKEALNNIVKHARAGEAWLRITATEDSLRMEIQDDGCGFDPSARESEANGLRNIRQRAAELNGECRIESLPGQGTKIAITVPLEQD